MRHWLLAFLVKCLALGSSPSPCMQAPGRSVSTRPAHRSLAAARAVSDGHGVAVLLHSAWPWRQGGFFCVCVCGGGGGWFSPGFIIWDL
jgi:hypothetical protein